MDERLSVAPVRERRSAATFVLIHGGWHGAWCWQRVAPMLRAAGHEVHMPTLTVLGERASLLAPRIDLETHARDAVEYLVREDLSGVTLAGHSYGGMVVSGAADRASERIARLVYLDAFVPEDGRSLFDLLRPERREAYLEATRRRGEGWRAPPPPPEALGVTDETEARWLAAMLIPQPIKIFEQPARLANPAGNKLPRTYLHCTDGPLAPSFAPFAARFRDSPERDHYELATGHDAMLTAPEELLAALLELAGEPNRGSEPWVQKERDPRTKNNTRLEFDETKDG